MPSSFPAAAPTWTPKSIERDEIRKRPTPTTPATSWMDTLLEDAYASRKPVLGICYGLQILNVYRAGSLVQHIQSPVNHEAGRKVEVAHTVAIDSGSLLAQIVAGAKTDPSGLPVNSSHHQSAEKVGSGLKVSARCPEDGIIEALESTDPDHFVLAVQWHPERSVDAASKAIFEALVQAAKK